VTDAKISGVISAGKLPVGTTSGTVAGGDHSHNSLYQKKYDKVAVVAQSGGDYSDPVIAMSNIATWCGTPSSSNPCLLKIMPGVYDLRSNTLYLQQYVDVEGSGENGTVITSAVYGGTWPPQRGTVNGANNAEIRFLTVAVVGNSQYSGAIVNINTSPKLTHITAATSGGGGVIFGVVNSANSSPVMTHVTAKATQLIVNTGSAYGVLNDHSTPTMTDVLAIGTGGNGCVGIENQYSSPTMTNVHASGSGAYTGSYGIENLNYPLVVMNNVTISASGANTFNMGILNYASSATMQNVSVSVNAINGTAMYNMSGNVLVDHSSFEGSATSVFNDQLVDIKIGASKLAGGLSGTGTATCVASYDGNYAPLNASCQ